MTLWIILLAAFVAVSAVVWIVASLVRGGSESAVEDRLEALTGQTNPNLLKGKGAKPTLLASPLDSTSGLLETFVSRIGSFQQIFEQADTTITPAQFLMISAGFGVGGAAAFAFVGIHAGLVPLMALLAGFIPLAWLLLKRRKRLKLFAKQLPDALELIARALRAGHSLASGFNLVATEMAEPIAKEFGRVFEEQNLGIPLEEALEDVSDRIPNLDLRFFVTAVTLQRETGGDLTEILDKIGHLIRERFKIWGQVQALTGEGRLSGIVLLALPPALFLAVWRLNPDYMVPLFTDPLGKKMLIGGIVLQLVGAAVIKKIVNIKV